MEPNLVLKHTSFLFFVEMVGTKKFKNPKN
jgi:hypothetical protein